MVSQWVSKDIAALLVLHLIKLIIPATASDKNMIAQIPFLIRVLTSSFEVDNVYITL